MKKIFILIISLCIWSFNSIHAQPVIIETADSTMLLPASASVPGPGMNPPTYGAQINGWDAGYVSWKIQITRPSNITVYANYTSGYDDVGLTINVSNGTTIVNTTPGTGGWGTFMDIKVGQITLNPGEYTFSMEVTSNAINFDHVRLTRKIVPLTLSTSVNDPSLGFIARSPFKDTYEIGDSVSLVAIPYPGYKLTGWSGDLISANPEDTIVMTGNQSVVATFEPGGVVYTDAMGALTLPSAVAKLDADGIAYSNGAISSWSTGSASWNIEVPCPITYIVRGEVSGPDTQASGSLNITINSISTSGHYTTTGTTYTYQDLCVVTLQSGTYQVNVSRVLTGSDQPINLKTLQFVKETTTNFVLQLNINNAQAGSVTSNPFKPFYNPNDSVIITATPVSGYMFTAWSGDLSSTKQTDTVVMTSNKTIQANFEISTSAKNPLDGKLLIYPNPFTRTITVDVAESQEIIKIELLNLLGTIVWNVPERLFQNKQIVLQGNDVERLPSGIYILHIHTKRGSIAYKIIKI